MHMLRVVKKIISICIFILLLLSNIAESNNKRDRCIEFIQPIRTNYFRYFGINFPYWYGIGCAKAESNCRQDLVSFDQGIGIFQLTPPTGVVKDIERLLNESIDPYKLEDNIRGHAFWMSVIWYKQLEYNTIKVRNKQINVKEYVKRCGKKLADMYIMYNGGWWFLYEASFTTSCNKEEIKKFCRRAKIPLKNGKILDLCEVNYSYPDKIYKFAIPYRLTNTDPVEFKYY